MQGLHRHGRWPAAARRHVSSHPSLTCGASGTDQPTAARSKKPISRRAAQLLEFADGWNVDGGQASSNAAQTSKNNTAGLLDEGWGVSPAAPLTPSRQATLGKKNVKKVAKKTAAPAASRASGGFMPMRGEDGALTLALLHHKLSRDGKLKNEDREQLLQAGADSKGGRKKKQLGMMSGALPGSRPPGRKRDVFFDEDIYEEEEDEEDLSDTPEFALNFLDEGSEIVDYDEKGNIVKVTPNSGMGDEDDDEDDYDDDDAEANASSLGYRSNPYLFGDEDDEDASGWGQFSADAPAVAGSSGRQGDTGMTDSEIESFMRGAGTTGSEASGAGSGRGGGAGTSSGTETAASRRRKELRRRRELESGDDGDSFGEQDDWGLYELGSEGQPRRPSLLQELGVVGSGTRGGSGRKDGEPLVQWGGTGTSASGIDLEAQEALLLRMFKPHRVKQLMEQQREAAVEWAAVRNAKSGAANKESKLHSQLRIVAGTAAGKRLLSSRGETTRPMMEKVRMAIFSMVQSQVGEVNGLPPTTRWLDLFAGTGSVGLEALSRGAATCHFVEMDSWVTKKVLSRNIETCSCSKRSIIHTDRAEDFLKKSIATPRFAGGPFDIISVCPPYLKVSYPELFGLLEKSPLVHPGTVMFVEYPKQLSREVPDAVGPLSRVRDRKYGRTLVAVYAAGDNGADGEDAEDEMAF